MQPSKVEGTLLKWTNYWNGWKPRWFVLDKNVLSYFSSQDEVALGCKGSVNIAAAIVTAHQSDACRLDVVVPGEQHFYLKAVSPHERQNWLVALGSAKSIVNSESGFKAMDYASRLTQKQCEVRIYCDLLMQQIHSTKYLVKENRIPDIQKMDEASSMIEATCDAFIHAVENCVRLAAPISPLDITGLTMNIFPEVAINDRESINTEISYSKDYEHQSSLNYKNNGVPIDTLKPTIESERSPHTFFSALRYSFARLTFKDNGDSSIKTLEFLQCAEELLKILDLLNEHAFSPIKMDLYSNIKKIYQKYNSCDASLLSQVSGTSGSAGHKDGCFGTIQGILYDEISKGTAREPHSATMTLIWLTRGLQFISEFLRIFLASLQRNSSIGNLTDIINEAYGKTIKHYHSWVLRGVFTLAAKETAPYEAFCKSLFINLVDPENNKQKLSNDISDCLAGLNKSLTILHNFYLKFDLLKCD